MKTISKTEFRDLKLFNRGKVRDIYEIGDKLLIVATDRLSAFDVVLPDAIPYKGKVLTGLSVFWFEKTSSIIPNHLITAAVTDYPKLLQVYKDELAGRSMLVVKARPVMIECVVRGYLAGSAYKEYKNLGAIAGEPLTAGMKEAQKLSEPIFTPAIKASSGHDENISFEKAVNLVGREVATFLKEKSLQIYLFAASYAKQRGIILADTKFEFGFSDNRIILIDEILTPDSSRLWARDSYQVGSSPPSFDKQFVRDYLESLNWDKNPPAPALPPEVIQKTSEKYLEAYQKITGTKLV
jgi:phosphoribosylaminoimidazole-succinocarboxamide synthase